MASRVAALLLLGVICVWFAAAEVPIDCCLDVGSKRFPIQILKHHIVQHAGQGCEIAATVFITKRGQTLCVSHPSQTAWVRAYIKYLEEKNKSTEA